jgi:hypothetical protein
MRTANFNLSFGCAITFCLLVHQSFSATPMIGKVIDQITQQPLGKTVVASSPFNGNYAISDDFGNFTLLIDYQQIDSITIFKIGYNQIEISILDINVNDTTVFELSRNKQLSQAEITFIKSLEPSLVVSSALESTKSLQPNTHHQLQVFFREIDFNRDSALAIVEASAVIDDQNYAKPLSEISIFVNGIWKSHSWDTRKYLPTRRYVPDVISSNLLYRTYEWNFFRNATKVGTVLNSIPGFIRNKVFLLSGAMVTEIGLQLSISFVNSDGNMQESGTILINKDELIVTQFDRMLTINDDLMGLFRVKNKFDKNAVYPYYIKLCEPKVSQIATTLEGQTYSSTEIYIETVSTQVERLSNNNRLSRIANFESFNYQHDVDSPTYYEKFPFDSLYKTKLEINQALFNQYNLKLMKR